MGEGEEEDYLDLRPVHVNWLVTTACGMKCRHCYVQNRFAGGELGAREARELLEEIARCGVRSICFTGGEPLARPGIFDLLELAAARGLSVSVVTSGAAVTAEAARRLAALRAVVYLSVDGAGREAHERVRGRGSWEVALRAARMLAGAGVYFQAVMTLSRLNCADAGAFPGTAKEMGAAAACLLPALPQGALGRNLTLGAGEFARAVYGAAEGAEAAGLNLHLWCTPFAGAFGDLGRRVRYWGCRGSPVADVSPTGELLLCDVLEVVLADCRGKGFAAACGEAAARPEFAAAHRPESPAGACRGCPEWLRCRGGCFARTYMETGDLAAPDPLCPRVAGAAARH